MTTYQTNEFRGGLKLLLDGQPFSIIENDIVKPGKGQAFNRVKLRNLTNGRVIERTFKSGESVDGADVMEIEVDYLYTDGEFYHVMQPDSFEQYQAAESSIAGCKDYLKEQAQFTMILWNGSPLTVEPPNFVNLTVAETEPGLKGDTSGGAVKPATLETGAVVRVPLFGNTGDILKIDTRTGDYVSRVKE